MCLKTPCVVTVLALLGRNWNDTITEYTIWVTTALYWEKQCLNISMKWNYHDLKHFVRKSLEFTWEMLENPREKKLLRQLNGREWESWGAEWWKTVCGKCWKKWTNLKSDERTQLVNYLSWCINFFYFI